MSELKNKEEVGTTKQKSIFSFLINSTTASKSENLVQNTTEDGANVKSKDIQKGPHQKITSKLKKSGVAIFF